MIAILIACDEDDVEPRVQYISKINVIKNDVLCNNVGGAALLENTCNGKKVGISFAQWSQVGDLRENYIPLLEIAFL